MILFEITGSEEHPAYQQLAIENVSRQYDFLQSAVAAAIGTGRHFISHDLLRALNFHAIACLHVSAGRYRPCEVSVGSYYPPAPYRVDALMDGFVNTANSWFDTVDPVFLSAYVLWRLNHIHPFINGNGRTARAACHFVLCVRSGGWLKGDPFLPQLLDRERDAYVKALRAADMSLPDLDLNLLQQLIGDLLEEQLGLRPAPPASSSTSGAADPTTRSKPRG